jgi:deoxyribose-phosphate aldolase
MRQAGEITDQELAQHIQHTIYRIGITASDIGQHCKNCTDYGFAAAMVPGRWVALAARVLHGTRVRVASAVDFPLGLMSDAGRVREALALVEAGADELD